MHGISPVRAGRRVQSELTTPTSPRSVAGLFVKAISPRMSPSDAMQPSLSLTTAVTRAVTSRHGPPTIANSLPLSSTNKHMMQPTTSVRTERPRSRPVVIGLSFIFFRTRGFEELRSSVIRAMSAARGFVGRTSTSRIAM